MKVFLKIVGTLLLAVVLFFTVTPAFLGSPSWTVTVDRVIDAPPAKIFAKLQRLECWKEWTNWEGLEFSGPAEGVGATLDWNSEGSTGRLVITEVAADREIAYDISMEEDRARSHGTITLRVVEAGTLVRWVESGDFLHEGEVIEKGVAGYFCRLFGAAMRASLKHGYADHLKKLDQLVRAADAAPSQG